MPYPSKWTSPGGASCESERAQPNPILFGRARVLRLGNVTGRVIESSHAWKEPAIALRSLIVPCLTSVVLLIAACGNAVPPVPSRSVSCGASSSLAGPSLTTAVPSVGARGEKRRPRKAPHLRRRSCPADNPASADGKRHSAGTWPGSAATPGRRTSSRTTPASGPSYRPLRDPATRRCSPYVRRTSASVSEV